MSDALKNVAGEKMKDILGMLSNNRFMGMITGAIVTAVIQTSSVTTVTREKKDHMDIQTKSQWNISVFSKGLRRYSRV